MTTLGRFYNWLTSWSLSSRRKVSNSSTGPTTSSNGSSVSLFETATASALKGDKLASSNIKKAVRFAEIQDGKVLAQVLNKNEQPLDKTISNGVRPLDETLDEVYIKDGVIRGFIQVKNLEPGRQVLVRYTDDNWKGFKQVKPKRVEKITYSKGKQQIRLVKQGNRHVLRRRKQVKPRTDTMNANQQLKFFLKIEVDQIKLSQVELVIISSLNNVIDTNHQQCYSFKCIRRSWEENVTHCSRDVNGSGNGNSRQS